MNPPTNVEDLKVDGHPQSNGDLHYVGSLAASGNRPTIAEQPLHTKRKLRVVCAGAGVGGLTLAYIIQHTGDYSYIDLSIYEKKCANIVVLILDYPLTFL